MWNWAWKPITLDLPRSVSVETFRKVLEAEGFSADQATRLRFRRPGSILSFRGERAPLIIELNGASAGIQYDTRWILGDTGDLARYLERLLARAAQRRCSDAD